jgi:hypothetical protein
MNALQTRLSALRRRLLLVTLTRGLSLLLMVLVGGAALAGWLDWEVNLPSLVRALLLVTVLGGAGYVGWRWLLAPLQARVDDLALALRIEEAYPSLNDALASTVQFLQEPGSPAAGSPSLRQEAVQRALRLAQGCDFTTVVRRRWLRLTALAALLVTATAVAAFVLQPAVAGIALLRLANPFGEHDWPSATELTLHFRDRIAIGQPFVIRGEVNGVIPGKAVLEFEGLTSSREVKEYPIKAAADGKAGAFQAKLDMTRQTHPFRFRARANDATFPRRQGTWQTIQVAQPPRLASLNGLPTPQLELHYPAYTDLPSPEKISPGLGRIEAIAGTNVILHAAADRPIALASVSYHPADPLALPEAFLAPLGQHTPFGIVAAAVSGQAVWDRVGGDLAADGRRFVIEFQPWVTGSYVLRLEDEDGLAKEYEYELRVLPDPPPTVSLERPSSNQSVLADADITLQVQAEDETFAIRSVYLEYRRKSREGQPLDEVPGRLPLFDHQAVGEALPQLLTALAPQPLPLFTPAWRLRPKRVQVTRRWALAGLAREGDILVIQACADDFNNVIAHPSPGRSVEVELRVVGKQALAAILDDAQAKIQQDLLRLREWQEKALKKVIEAQEQARAAGKLRAEDFDGLVEAEQLQKQIQARIGATPDEGLRAELRRLEQMIRDNRLPPSGAQDRLKVMKAELERLAQQHVPQIEPEITTARQKLAAGADTKQAPAKGKKDAGKTGSDAGKSSPDAARARQEREKGEGELAKARAHQEEVQQSLDELLKYLEHWAGTQEMRGEIRAALQEQRDLKAELERVGPDPQPGDDQAQAAVRKVAEFQRRLADKTQRLIDKMERVAQERAEKDPAGAEMLEKAAQIGKDAMLPLEMSDTDKQLREKDPATGQNRPQVNRAIGQQGESIKTLEQMVKALDEQRKDEIERLVKKQKGAQKELDELGERLEKLRKKVEQARKIPDAAQRKAELKKLAEEQRKLEEEARKKSRELARLQAPRAGKEMARAAEEMGKAARKLEEGEDPDEAQQEAQDRLDRAQDDLQEAQKEAENELAREQLARIADQIKGLKERQDAAIEESQRLHRQMLKAGWTRALVASLKQHGQGQAGLGKEAAGLTEKLKGAPVFEMLLKKSGKAMQEATQRIAEHREKAILRQGMFPLDKEELADENRFEERLEKHQKEASRRLERLLDALKPELNTAQRPPEDGQPGGGGGQKKDGKGLRPGDGIPPVAQLRALRDEQKDVKERTESFARLHPEGRDLTAEQRAELEAIHAEQEELFRLFRELSTSANEGEKQ